MFERFSRPALRVLFWARAEAGRLGSDWIEPEHLLLGVLAEDQRDWMQAIPRLAGKRSISVESDSTPAPAPFFTADCVSKLRQILSASAGRPKLDAVDMPLAKRSKQVLAATAQRADGRNIGLLHILWGLVSEADNSVSDVLKSVGVTVDQIDSAIRSQQT
jgi:ATP-dependent Clp protease ATP-binding subunit ClpC